MTTPDPIHDDAGQADAAGRGEHGGIGPRRVPDVLIDCEKRAGVLLLVMVNIGEEPALRVRVAFAAPLRGMGGEVVISDLPIFRRLAMLRPGRQIVIPIDTAHGFFARGEATSLRVRVRYRDRAGTAYCGVFRHDLAAFGGLPELVPGMRGSGNTGPDGEIRGG